MEEILIPDVLADLSPRIEHSLKNFAKQFESWIGQCMDSPPSFMKAKLAEARRTTHAIDTALAVAQAAAALRASLLGTAAFPGKTFAGKALARVACAGVCDVTTVVDVLNTLEGVIRGGNVTVESLAAWARSAVEGLMQVFHGHSVMVMAMMVACKYDHSRS